MQFAYPFLLSGLLLASVPLIIHLLNRRRFQVVEWAPMRYLKLTLKNNRRRLRLEQWLLLLIRTLVVVALILAVARPRLTSASLSALVGSHARASQVLVIDDSLSMGYELEQRSAFSQAKDAAADLIAAFPSQDELTILLTSAPDAPLVGPVHPREQPSLVDTVRHLELTHTANDWGATLRAVDQLLTTATFPTRRVTLITDLRRSGWSSQVTAVTQRWAGVAPTGADTGRPASGGALPGAGAGVDLRIIDVGSRQTQNVALLTLHHDDPPVVLPNTPVSLRATLRNDNPNTVPPMQATLSVGEQSRPVMLPELPPGQTIDVPLTISFPNPGQYPVRLLLPDDALPQDDARWLSIEVRPSFNLLLVDGAPSPQPFDSATDFLAVAFTAGSDAWHVQRITDPDMLVAMAAANVSTAGDAAVTPGSATAPTSATGTGSATASDQRESAVSGPAHEPHAGVDVVVLANVTALKPGQVRALEKMVAAGTGLMIFMGDQVDLAAYNDMLYANGKGLMPARLDAVVDEPVTGLVVESLDRSPLEPLRHLAPAALTRIQAAKVVNVIPPAHAEQPVRVLARWNDTLGRPAVIEKQFGRGRVILWTMTADRHWTDWPVDPTFVLATRSAAMTSARPGASSDPLTVGQPVEVDFPPQVTPVEPRILAPGMEAPQAILAGRTPAAQAMLSYRRTPRAGIYRLSWHDSLGAPQARLFALNPDPAESDLDPITDQELRRLVSPLELRIDRPNQAGANPEVKRPELWRTFVTALLVLMAVETVLAVWVGRER